MSSSIKRKNLQKKRKKPTSFVVSENIDSEENSNVQTADKNINQFWCNFGPQSVKELDERSGNREVAEPSGFESKESETIENIKKYVQDEMYDVDHITPVTSRRTEIGSEQENLSLHLISYNLYRSDDENHSETQESNGRDEFTTPKIQTEDVRCPPGNKKKKKRYAVLAANVQSNSKRIESIEKDVKELKMLLKYRSDSSSKPRSITKYCDASNFVLLPKFPIKKMKYVTAMETNAGNERDYKTQLIQKFSTIGGSCIKKMVINIFKRTFSGKLKTKMCWKGSPGPNGKVAFENFTHIRDALRVAVSYHFEDCTEENIEEECKLRFNQAQKDYDREKQKKRALEERFREV